MSRVSDWPAMLARARVADSGFGVFGAAAHRYELSPTLSEARLRAFEAEHGVRLPADYRAYLASVGNGGAGPYYGVFPLGLFDGAGSGLTPWTPGDGFAGTLSTAFPHTEHWNLPDSAFAVPERFIDEAAEDAWYRQQEEVYWAPELVDGAFPICHEGCAYRNLLVVAPGPEYGNIWIDGRASDGGIAPVLGADGQRLSFGEWYEDWLEAAAEGQDFF